MVSRLTRGYQHLTFSRWYLLVRVWLLVWITTVPLFHIHLPDTTDRWSILQSSGAHTVLTADLPGEYASLSHDSHKDASPPIATRCVNSPELGFHLRRAGQAVGRLRSLGFALPLSCSTAAESSNPGLRALSCPSLLSLHVDQTNSSSAHLRRVTMVRCDAMRYALDLKGGTL